MKKTKRVLIVSELFFPSSRIGAVRPTKLAKYLWKRGYNVTVYTSSANLDGMCVPDLPYNVLYSHSTESEMNAFENNVRQNGRTRAVVSTPWNKILQEFRMTKRQILSIRDGKRFLESFKENLDNETISLNSYDCVFTTFGPIGSLLAGATAKKRCPSLCWICDFRDPMVSQIMPKIIKPFYMELQRRSIRAADITTTVSAGYAKRMNFPRIPRKIEVIPNGFDQDDRPQMIQSTDSKFSMAYVGALYEGKRDISVLFKNLRFLVDEGKISEDNIVFHYAGGEGAYCREQASRFQMEKIVCDHGIVSREESIKIQSSVRFLVLSTWNSKGEEGVFPGKLLEYMLMEKPIISMVSGSLPSSEVTQIINKYRLGVSYEQISNDADVAFLQWLKNQVDAYNKGAAPVFSPDREGIGMNFDWENTIERFCAFIDE